MQVILMTILSNMAEIIICSGRFEVCPASDLLVIYCQCSADSFQVNFEENLSSALPVVMTA